MHISQSINGCIWLFFMYFSFRNESHLFDSQSTKYVLFRWKKKLDFIKWARTYAFLSKHIRGWILLDMDIKIRFQYTFIKWPAIYFKTNFSQNKNIRHKCIFFWFPFDWNRIFRRLFFFVFVIRLFVYFNCWFIVILKYKLRTDEWMMLY